MAELVLAVDVGSTWCKAAYLDQQGSFVASGRAYTGDIVMDRNRTLPRFWHAFVAATRAATAQLPAGSQPAALGISTRALFGVCQNQQGESYLPAWDILLDRRTSPDVQAVYRAAAWSAQDPPQDPHAYGYAIGVTGLLRWLKHNRPAEWQAIWRVGALHDDLLYRLTGAWITDPATGPGVLTWPAVLVQMTGLPASAFPTVAEPDQSAGHLTAAAAQALALPASTPVVVGMHDGAAANLGVGAIHPGDACFTLGTNLVLRVVAGATPLPGGMGYPVAPGSWAWVGNVPGASRQLDVVAHTLRPAAANVAIAHRDLGTLVEALAPGQAEPCLPLYPIEAEAELRQQIRWAQRAGYTDGLIYQAVLKSVGLGVRALVARAQSAGATPTRFVATGGHTQNQTFLQMLANLLCQSITVGTQEGGILGAGMAAAVGAGWFADLHQAAAQMGRPVANIEPA